MSRSSSSSGYYGGDSSGSPFTLLLLLAVGIVVFTVEPLREGALALWQWTAVHAPVWWEELASTINEYLATL
jgi:hypothetical protein